MDVHLRRSPPIAARACPTFCGSDFCLSGLPLTLCIRSLAVHLLHLWPERLPHAGRFRRSGNADSQRSRSPHSIAPRHRSNSRRPASPASKSTTPSSTRTSPCCGIRRSLRPVTSTRSSAPAKRRGPLHGIPTALKDNIDTAGIRTTAASAVFDDRVPQQDAEMTRCRQHGSNLPGLVVVPLPQRPHPTSVV
jgi:hypothetical protein